MEKSYQICDAGDKVVLRQLTEPDYEMRTILVADALIDIRDAYQRKCYTIADKPFFIFMTEDQYFLCWERRKLLQVAHADDYCLFENNVLLKRGNCWYWWKKDADVSGLQPLGMQITSLDRLFILKQRQGYILNYFEQNGLHMHQCFAYEVLNDISLVNEKAKEFFPDVLCFTDEKGKNYLSVEKNSEILRAHGRTLKNVFYSFEFKNEPSERLIEFTAYVRDFYQKMSDNGMMIEDRRNICDYAYLRDYIDTDLIISININLQGGFHSNIAVYANISKLYRHEDEAYQVYCAELEYYNTVDNIWLVNDARQKKFMMICDGRTDMISCSIGDLDEKALSLSQNV